MGVATSVCVAPSAQRRRIAGGQARHRRGREVGVPAAIRVRDPASGYHLGDLFRRERDYGTLRSDDAQSLRLFAEELRESD